MTSFVAVVVGNVDVVVVVVRAAVAFFPPDRRGKHT